MADHALAATVSRLRRTAGLTTLAALAHLAYQAERLAARTDDQAEILRANQARRRILVELDRLIARELPDPATRRSRL